MCLAIPMKVVELLPQPSGRLKGTVELGGVKRAVDLSLVKQVQPGQYVIVHAGFAISISNEEEARKTLELYQELVTSAQEAGVAGADQAAVPSKSPESAEHLENPQAPDSAESEDTRDERDESGTEDTR